jgi:zinc transport system substrate-binding protein
MNKRFISLAILLLLVSAAGWACQREQKATDKGQLKVVVTLFPLYDFARNIAGDRAKVTLLLPPGVEVHSFEPKAGDMLRINEADIFLYTGKYMEPWAEGVLRGVDNKSLLVVDTSKGITLMKGADNHSDDHEGKGNHNHDTVHGDSGKIDPHIWLDLANAQTMVNTIAEALVTRDPAGKETYLRNADAYRSRLAELDLRFKQSLANCKRRAFIHGGHFAFGYLARRYDLHYVSAYFGSPDSEPTPARIIALKKKIQEGNSRYVYYEELITPRVAEVLARETGATLLRLHGAHNITKDEFDKSVSFISIMEENLKSLRTGLECQ